MRAKILNLITAYLILLALLAGDTAQAQSPSDEIFKGIFRLLKKSHAHQLSDPAISIQNDRPASNQTFSVGGNRLDESTTLTGDYSCKSSKQFRGFQWCVSTVQKTDPRGAYIQATAVARSLDGRSALMRRSLNPAFFSDDEIRDDINGLSNKFRQEAKIVRVRSSGIDATMAVWGTISLHKLSDLEIRSLRSDRTNLALIVDFANDLDESLRRHLPIYRLASGRGFVWIASRYTRTSGRLSFLAANCTTLIEGEPQAPRDKNGDQSTEEPPTGTAAVSQTQAPPQSHVTDPRVALPARSDGADIEQTAARKFGPTDVESGTRVAEASTPDMDTSISGRPDQQTYEKAVNDLMELSHSDAVKDSSNVVRMQMTLKRLEEGHRAARPKRFVKDWTCQIESVGAPVMNYSDGYNAQEHIGFNPSGNELGIICAESVRYLLVLNGDRMDMNFLATLNRGDRISFSGEYAGRRLFDMTSIVKNAEVSRA